MNSQSEAQLEKWLIDSLNKQFAYSYYKQIDDKESLESNFRLRLFELNKEDLKDTAFTDAEFDRILTYLKDKSVFQSAKHLRDKFVLEREDNSKVHIKFIDFDDFGANKVEVANQITVFNKYETRFDVTILINGLPLVQIELKKRGVGLDDAFNQTERYRRHAYTGLFKYIQIFVITNGTNTKYYANSDEAFLHSSAFYWTDKDNKRINDIEDFVPAFFNRDRLFKLLGIYTVLNDSEKKMLVMRPYQIYATEALLQKASFSNDNGYIWHTTGSGKTLTCWKCAKLLIQNPSIKKVFFLIDRRDLDTQTTEEFNKFEADSVDPTNNTKTLSDQTKDKNKKLIITTIQKMSHAISEPKYKSIMARYADEKVVFLIDECHRTQFGEMHKAIKKFFHKAQYFGFTGTPIFEKNAKKEGEISYITESLFGKPLHQYMIKQAIADGNVLGFKIEYMKTVQAKDSVYEEKMNESEASGTSTEVSAIDTAEVWGDERRIEAVCKNIIKNFNSKTVNKNYNAILATSSVENLIKYYDTFKRLNSDLIIGAVFTYDVNEDAETKDETSQDAMARIIDDYNNLFSTSFKTDTFADYNKDLSKKFRANKINLLLVVRMYLTGFNSKRLNTLYVDKNLVYQDLLQSYSRTNRTEKATKKFGNIVCYRNLKYNTDEAIKLYSNSSSTEGIIQKDFQYFLERLETALGMLGRVVDCPEDAGNLQSEEEQKKYILAFRAVMRLITTLKTFEEFEFTEEAIGISEEDFDNYKSQYLDIYKNLSRRDTAEKASILDQVDFQVELLETDVVNVDLTSSKLGRDVKSRSILIAKVMKSIDTIDFELENTEIDVLGDAYEYLIGMYAATAGKKAGEFYTPQSVSKLLSLLATDGLKKAKAVCDCACGSGSLLLQVGKCIKVGHYYGNECNPTTYNLARMNMILHNIHYEQFDIRHTDTITDGGENSPSWEEKYQVQVANPPYSQKWSASDKYMKDDRFSPYGKLAPKSYEDMAFLEHMIFHMTEDDARIAVLLPHGVLFRGGAEEAIRTYIVKNLNYLDAVIGLAPNCFYGTSIPVSLLLLKNNRDANKGNILFIDASKEYEPGKNQNSITEGHVQKILNAYKERKDVEKFCHVATMKEYEKYAKELGMPL